MTNEFDEDDLFESLADKKANDRQQRELTNVLKQLIVAIGKDGESDAKLIQTLSNNNYAINIFLNKVRELINKPDVEPKINIDNGKLAEEIKVFNDLARKIIEGQKELLEMVKMKPKEMKAVRQDNFADSPIASFKILY